ncbi:MAG TPA: sigma-54-dependent Fis family transcriptional regulator [Chromatiales bacterium]|nr:sigma-54-dependent Fis family transcriptional regulator [Chromatiales bacterium]
MADTPARTLVFCGHCVPEMKDGLREQGWTLERVAHWREMPAAIERCGARVAMIELAPSDEENLHAIERMVIEHTAQEWLAIAPNDLLKRDAVAEMIYSVFFDYFSPPLKPERLLLTLGHAWGMAQLGLRLCMIRDHGEHFEGLIGDSPAMQVLKGQIKRLAPVDMPVLITGASGTGKELAANNIHRLSSRRDKPFIAINCGALPEKLVQSELFGHEKGAFTGATTRKTGRIEAAHGGTLFLDEIGDLPLEAQVNLLRFLQEGTIERVGSHQPIKVDARIIAATHVDLEQAVANGRFREDLFFRLNVLRLRMPWLRERGRDIEKLARHFIDLFALEHGLKPKSLSQASVRALVNHGWPGNVRELMNRIRRAMVMAEGRVIAPAHLELDASPSGSILPTLAEARDRAEREAILATLEGTEYNVSATARMLDVSRVTLYRMMKKHGIELNEASIKA